MDSEEFLQVLRLIALAVLAGALIFGVNVNGRHYSVQCGKPAAVQP